MSPCVRTSPFQAVGCIGGVHALGEDSAPSTRVGWKRGGLAPTMALEATEGGGPLSWGGSIAAAGHRKERKVELQHQGRVAPTSASRLPPTTPLPRAAGAPSRTMTTLSSSALLLTSSSVQLRSSPVLLLQPPSMGPLILRPRRCRR
ncbi:Os07g0435200 [Oryza sativa Japonica Group]|uniref:Os07g0435200 protein n=1 Tax=Oryza sativa subsp. japonica TaxID=39947 RepID=A0A0P0X587_ORYSJ|nr:Os07g0435200 [Oryza sativa Japonica Group]